MGVSTFSRKDQRGEPVTARQKNYIYTLVWKRVSGLSLKAGSKKRVMRIERF